MNFTSQEAHTQVDQIQLRADTKQFCENWIWRAVECLIDSPQFEASPKWASKRLNVSVEKIVEAFEGLERLGYIQRTGSSYAKSTKHLVLDTKFNQEELIAIHSRVAPQVISKLNSSSKFTSRFLLGNKELVAEYAPKFSALINEMMVRGSASGTSEVVAMEMSFALLTEDAQGGVK